MRCGVSPAGRGERCVGQRAPLSAAQEGMRCDTMRDRAETAAAGGGRGGSATGRRSCRAGESTLRIRIEVRAMAWSNEHSPFRSHSISRLITTISVGILYCIYRFFVFWGALPRDAREAVDERSEEPRAEVRGRERERGSLVWPGSVFISPSVRSRADWDPRVP